MLISKHPLEWVAWREIPWQVGDIRVSMHGYTLSCLAGLSLPTPSTAAPIHSNEAWRGNPGPWLNDLGPKKWSC